MGSETVKGYSGRNTNYFKSYCKNTRRFKVIGVTTMKDNKPKHIQYMCTHCGMKVIRAESAGRPMPGRCPRRTNGRPHVWVKNKTM